MSEQNEEKEELEKLRRALSKPKSVKEIELKGLTKFPREVAKLTSLETLDFHFCAFEAVPKEIAALPKLAKLELNWIQGFKVLPEEVLAMPSLREVSFYESDLPKTYQQAQINALLKGFAKSNASVATRLLHVALLLGNDERASKLGTVAELANALDSNVAAVRSFALRVLAKKLGTPKPKIAKDTEIVIAGKLAVEMDVLQERLAKRGAKIAKKIGPKTTAIVLGEQPKGKALPLVTEAKKRKDITIVVEEHLRSVLDTPFLVAEAKKGDGATAARIGELLASPDSGSRKLAVEMMKKGGVPKGVYEELLLLTMDTTADKKLREGAKKLFEQYAPNALKDGVKKVLARTSFYASGETKVRARIEGLAKEAKGAIDPIKLATLLLPARKGFSYLFASGDEPALVALDALTKGDTLDLSGGELDELPSTIAKLPGLRKLLLGFGSSGSLDSRNHLRTIPDVVLGLTKLEELDISENRLSSIPDSIEKLTSLRVLDASGNFIRKFPTAVLRLKKLRKLDLSTIRYGGDREIPLKELPEEISALRDLEELTFASHHLPALPEGLRALKKLRRLDLNNVKIPVLPMWLAEMPALKELDLGWVETDKKVAKAIARKLRARGAKVEGV